MHCAPYLESVDAHVRLAYPSLEINRTFTPRFEESTRKSAGTIEIPGIGENLLIPYQDELDQTDEAVDGFFGTILQQGISLASLMNNTDALKEAVESVYPKAVTQVLNQNRISIQSVPVNGTLKTQNRLRLRQDVASTRILQALLLTMALCAGATFFLGDTSQILPKNPRTIAASASLLAGSDLLQHHIPPGSEWCSDEELEKHGIFKGLLFSMGWWRQQEDNVNDGDDASGSRKSLRFGIDVGRAEKDL